MTERNALQGVVDAWLDLVSPLATAAVDEPSLRALLADMGWSVQAIDLGQLATAVTALNGALEALRASVSLETLSDLIETLNALASTAQSLTRFAEALAAAAGTPSAAEDVIGALAEDTMQHLTLLWIGRRSATAYAVMELLGLITERVAAEKSSGGPAPLVVRAATARTVLNLQALGPLLQDPAAYLRTRLGLRELTSAQVAQDVVRSVFGPLGDLVVIAGGDAVVGLEGRDSAGLDPAEAGLARRATLTKSMTSFDADGDPSTTSIALTTEYVPAGMTSVRGDAGPGVLLTPYGSLTVRTVVPGATLDLEMDGAVAAAYFPSGAAPVVHGAPSGVTLALRYARVPPEANAPVIVLGSTTTGVTISGFHVDVRAAVAKPGAPALDVEATAAVDGARLALAVGEGDGFLATVMPPDGLTVDFDLGLGWSNRRGVFFTGGAGLEADFPLNVSLAGVITIDVLHLGLRLDDATAKIVCSVSATFNLGPFVVSIERVGASGVITFPSSGGNLGALDLAPAFKPPTGLGLAINTPAVSGGGFIGFDPDAGRYSGVFELTIVNTVSVKVVGIITTKLANGDPGFALLIIITAEGFTPIQLGMGFALTGIGGLLALNRTIDLDVIRGGLQTGVLDSVLFVKDPVANAPRILATLDRVFPLAPDRLLVGPLAEISWGTPALVKIRLALLLQVGDRIKVVLLAAIGVALPDEKTPVVELHIDAIGALDFERGELSLDASLHDSRILLFTLTGDMALRLNWGSEPTFLLSVGGFHPRFKPPADLRPLNRLSLSLTDGTNPRIRFETYLAVTSNTIQMGARVELYAEFAGFGIDGGGGFDALVQWSPFAIDVSFSAWVSIFGTLTGPLIAARVAIDVTGPEPWHVTGVAEVTFLALSAKIPIDFTTGAAGEEPVIETVDVEERLWTELSQQGNWQDVLPAGIAPGVTLAPARSVSDEQSSVMVVHPLSTLTLEQKVVPLATPISRVGARLPQGGVRSYDLDVSAPDGVRVEPRKQMFAPGQYREQTDDAKLTGAAFEDMVAGVTLRSEAAATFATEGSMATDLVFETKDITQLGSPSTPGFTVAADARTALQEAPPPRSGVDRATSAVAWSVVPS